MGNSLHYEGFVAHVEFSEEDSLFRGRVVGIKEPLAFSGESVSGLIADFHRAVDDYLARCAKEGRAPEKPYKGSFNVRIQADLHRQAATLALQREISLNAFVEESIRAHVESETERAKSAEKAGPRVIGLISNR